MTTEATQRYSAMKCSDWVTSVVASMSGLSADQVDGAMSLFDLGIDSIGLYAVIGQAQAAFGFQLSEEETIRAFRASTVRDLVTLVELGQGRGVAAAT